MSACRMSNSVRVRRTGSPATVNARAPSSSIQLPKRRHSSGLWDTASEPVPRAMPPEAREAAGGPAAPSDAETEVRFPKSASPPSPPAPEAPPPPTRRAPPRSGRTTLPDRRASPGSRRAPRRKRSTPSATVARADSTMMGTCRARAAATTSSPGAPGSMRSVISRSKRRSPSKCMSPSVPENAGTHSAPSLPR